MSEPVPPVPAPAPTAPLPLKQRVQERLATLRARVLEIWLKLLPKLSKREQKALDRGSDWSPRWLSVFAMAKTPDGPTRRGVLVYGALSAALVVVFVGGSIAFWRRGQERAAREAAEQALQAKIAAERAEDAADIDDRRGEAEPEPGADDPELLLPVGNFTIELSQPGGGVASGDFDLVLRVDSSQTKAILGADPVRTRDVITAALRPMERDVFLSREGKARLKRTIVDRLNGLLKSGRVREALFPNYLVH